MHSRSFVKMATLAALGLPCPTLRAHAAAPETVSFPGSGLTASVTLSGAFYRAATAGRAPVVVLLHPCNGIAPFVQNWAAWFVAHGYSALIVDSLAPRGVVTLCGRPASPDTQERGFDALGALAWLRTRPDVDGERIGAIGWSDGGGAAMAADAAENVAQSDVAGGGFRAVVGFDPSCGQVHTNAIAAPLLLLLGGNDESQPPQFCNEVVARLDPGGPPAIVHIYPGEPHAFDNQPAHGTDTVLGKLLLLANSSRATADAHKQVLTFFAAQLR
jgi:dienelactone hydrolase